MIIIIKTLDGLVSSQDVRDVDIGPSFRLPINGDLKLAGNVVRYRRYILTESSAAVSLYEEIEEEGEK